MPEERTTRKAKNDLKEGKSPSTAAGEFVHEEIEHVRKGKHGAWSAKQAVAIGLSKARRAGIPVKPPAEGKTSGETRSKAEKDYEKGQRSPRSHKEGSTPRSKARMKAMKREPKSSASHAALSRQAKSAAKRRQRSS
ncbi:DNA-binding protein [Acidicapsa dinghuensis]|uniref:DNA-binding protein n=1 Tax=Acidicapsa dinghuensis TaxID=2218256 RepID=A0ABW1ELF8_9BACT|nr:DNA-binding protein [Acidicapsa dinghuensis]